MDKITWIVIANSTQVRIFNCKSIHNLDEIETLIHPESRFKGKELASDRGGVTGDGRNTKEQPHTPKENEMHAFAKSVANHLELARSRGEVECIFLASNPSFLGLLRSEMTTPLRQIVTKTVDKDITHMKPANISSYFFIGA